MPRMDELAPNKKLWKRAVEIKPPRAMACMFACFVGQFPARSEFDALARQVWDLYAEQSLDAAWDFRLELKERLHRRYRGRVVWDADDRSRQGQGARRWGTRRPR